MGDVFPASTSPPGDALDVAFGPRLIHRIRFVEGLFDSCASQLAELTTIEGGVGRARVFIDSGVSGADPEIVARITRAMTAAGVDMPLPPLVVPGGEAIKNDPGRIDELVRAMHDSHLCRRSCAVAVGGGAVLDAVGYAAAITHRGVRLIRVPTSTLAQADSCVAVKCGVNAFGKKNYLGVFASPWAVVIDPALLRTLSDRDWRCGFSEAVKVGLVKDPGLFEQLRATAGRIAARELSAAWPIIRRSAEIHLRHITDGGDPFELTAARPLDFGHWAAHRLESMTAYELRHGEAVAIGIALDATYSSLRGWLNAEDAVAVRSTLNALGFRLQHPALARTSEVMAGLDEFREHLGGRLTISMLRGIGQGFDVHEIDTGVMRDALRVIQEPGLRRA